MRARIAQTGGKAIAVNAVGGTYVVLLGMEASPAARKGLLGFAIQRTDLTEHEKYWLAGFKTFEKTNPNPKPGTLVSTREAPIQGFLWGDYTAKPDHEYVYEVVPVYGAPDDLRYGEPVKVQVRTENEDSGTHAIYFNRGVAGSQAYVKKFGDASPKDAGPDAFKWLSRGLEEAILGFIGHARGSRYSLRASAYEFSHRQVLGAFKKAADDGADVKIVYDCRQAEPHTTSDKAIKKAGIRALMIRREANPSYISHNKFIILLKDGKPVEVLTGSANFTDGGIYGQSNVVHIVRDPQVAAQYLKYWTLLAEDAPASQLRDVTAEHTPDPSGELAPGIHPVFSPRPSLNALKWYAGVIDGAEKLSGFTAAFGVNVLIADVLAKNRHNRRYVMLEKPGPTFDQFSAIDNNLIAIGAVLDTSAVGDTELQRWVGERLTGLNSNVRYLHTKYLFADPMGSNPIVISGSANFSNASTRNNDENMLIVQGDTTVADIYLGEFMRLWSHFRFRDVANRYAAVNKGTASKRAGQHGDGDHVRAPYLKPDDSWIESYFGSNPVKTMERELLQDMYLQNKREARQMSDEMRSAGTGGVPIGAEVCAARVDPGLLPGDGQMLTHANRECLWRLFQQIGVVWKNVRYESSNLKSSWLEMIDEKIRTAPSYTGEYINAIHVVTELVAMYGETEAYRKLFLENGIPAGPPTTRLAHAKRFVVDEFIKVQVMMSGFKQFGGENYQGYVKGSRYNRHPQVRVYRPGKEHK